MSTVISYPIPLYQNLPIEPQWYKPSQFPITNITLGRTTIITMANGTNNVSPNYVIGQNVRLMVPSNYGTYQLSGKSGLVISIPMANQVEINIDSSNYNAFIASPPVIPGQSQTPPQITAIGDFNSGAINPFGNMHTKTYIPGSFRDISPY